MSTMVERAPLDLKTFSRPLPEDAPRFCPICGRALLYSFWDTVDGDTRYHSFVCFGSHSRLYRWFRNKVRATTPGGTHYRYEFGPTPNRDRVRFDMHTGKRLSE